MALRHHRSRSERHAPLPSKRERMSRNLAASIRVRLKRYADAAKQTQWNAFLKKNRLDAIALADVVTLLRNKFHKVGVI